MKIDGIPKTQPITPFNPPGRGDNNSTEKAVNKTDQKDQSGNNNNDEKEISKAVDTLNKTMENYYTELQFVLHKGSGEYMVKVINTKDNTVIREIPPERVLDMVAHFKKMLGLIVDKFI